MEKKALGDKITSAYKTEAGKAREAGQKPVMHGQRKITSIPLIKSAMGMPMSYGARGGVAPGKTKGLGAAAAAMRPGNMTGRGLNAGAGMAKISSLRDFVYQKVRAQ